MPNGNVIIVPGGPNVTLPAYASLSCLDATTALIDVNFNQTATVWQLTGQNLTLQGSLLKPAYMQNTYTSTSNIVFLNQDGLTWQFYDFRLFPVTGNLTINLLLPPTSTAFYQTLPNKLQNNVMLVATGDDPTELVSLDYYALVGTALVYQGTFPLLNHGTVDLRRVILLPTVGALSIDYGITNNVTITPQTVTYNLSSPPQQIRGHFYDATLQDCSGYLNALFRFNNASNSREMIVINALNLHPIFERYPFTETTVPLLPLAASATLSDYVFTKMEAYFDQQQQNLLIYGIQQNSTDLSDTVHIRNANNLDATFTQSFFSESDFRDVQAFGLFGNNLISAVTNVTTLAPNDTITTITSAVASQGKISTGNATATVDMFAACALCSYVAVAASNSTTIQLVSLVSGLIRANITTPYALASLAISADGSKVAYQCTNSALYVYDNNMEQTYFQSSQYLQISNYYFLSNSWLIIINNGAVIKLSLTLSLAPSHPSHQGTAPVQQAQAGSQNVTVAVDNNRQVYAFSPAPQ
jgi:hypothetical protein